MIRSRLVILLLSGALVATLTPNFSSADEIDRSKKIALLFDSGGPGDGSYNDAARSALRKTAKKYRLFAPNVRELITDGTVGDRIYRLRLMARSGYYLMIAVGSNNAEAVRRVSLEYPELEFSLLNDGTVSGLNVASLIFDEGQAAYMAGFTAALTSTSREILYIAKDQAESDRLAPQFERGAKAARVAGGVKVGLAHMGMEYVPLLDTAVDRIYSTWNLDSALLNQIIIRNRERTRVGQMKLIANTPDQYFVNLELARPHLLLTIDRNIDKAIDLIVGSTVRDEYVLNLLDGVNNIFGRRFTFANRGLTIGYRSEIARKAKPRIDAEIERIRSKQVKF
jgi:basic membrane protein A